MANYIIYLPKVNKQNPIKFIVVYVVKSLINKVSNFCLARVVLSKV